MMDIFRVSQVPVFIRGSKVNQRIGCVKPFLDVQQF
jgi:hypothetical protein